ncbi:hypothetical protein [Agarilytica rhodophyticola]|uniref:hypothetical protein n=1 Tax=Agarilytica rhodophyticola TaxID=1737490 RepID=UPI000CD84271|nr:hypothetical protein [Agarilytica rhodophyticola]
MKLRALVMLLFSANAMASDVTTSKIKELLTYNSNDFVFVSLEKIPGNKPTCATNPYDYIFHLKSDQGKAIYSKLLAAYVSGKSLTFKGTDECDPLQANAEVLHYVSAK